MRPKLSIKGCQDVPPQIGGPEKERIGNNIYFYKEVNGDSIHDLMRELDLAEADILVHSIENRVAPYHINLHINTYGGVITDALAALGHIRRLRVPIYSIIDGYCASAGTLFSVACTKRYMYQDSMVLIHQLSDVIWGKYNEICDEKKNADMFMSKIKEIYARYTKAPKEKLDEILKHDLWWDAKTCKKYGLVDEVI